MSGEDVNDCMVPCDKWGEVAWAAPTPTLARNGKELSCASLGEPEVGEAGKEHLLERTRRQQNAERDESDVDSELNSLTQD
jgi:hypothetical protein